MKKLILIFLLLATSLQAQWFVPNPKGLLRLNNTWTGTQTYGHVFIDSSLSLYNLNGNRWFYANGEDSTLTIHGRNIKLLKSTIDEESHDVAFGDFALANNLGFESSAFGWGVLRDNTGSGSSAFGYEALRANIGTRSSAFGYQSGFQNKGNYISAFGNLALGDNTGDYCLGFGLLSLYNNRGDNSLGLGNYTKKYEVYASNKLYIDNLDRQDSVGSANNSLIIGTFATNSNDQTLTLNAQTTAISYKQKSVVTIADSVINCNLSNTFSKTLGANQRFVLSNIGDGQTINIAVTNTASNYTVTWVEPAS